MNKPVITAEIAQLFNQQLSEYWEIQDLKVKLMAAEARHQGLALKIRAQLKAQETSCTR